LCKLNAFSIRQGSQDLLNNELTGFDDFGLELGGPIVRDRLWIWGSYGSSNYDGLAFSAGEELDTSVDNSYFNAKLTTRPSPENSLTVGVFYADREKISRNYEPLLTPDATFINDGAPDYWKVEDTHIFNSNFYLTGLYSQVNGGFDLVPRGGIDNAAFVDENSVWHNSFQLYQTDRPQEQFRADASSFFNTGSLSHELKFGGNYRSQDTRESSEYPFDQIAVELNDQLYYYFTRSWERTIRNEYTSAYLQDTLAVGNLTANLGLRYDLQSTQMTGGSVSAHPTEGNFLQQRTFGLEDPFEWSGISPRLGLAYQLGDRTLLRANYGRFIEQLGTTPAEFGTAATMNPFYESIVKQGSDVDGNGVLGPAEPQVLAGVFQIDPVNLVDDELDSPAYRELLFGVEHALLPEFVVGLTLSFRSVTHAPAIRDLLTNGQLATASDYVPSAILSGSVPDFGAYSVQTYRLNPTLQFNGQQQLTQGEGEQEYMGASLVFNKRLANRWMLRGNVNWQDWNWNISDEQGAASDPNRVLGRAFDEDPVIFRSGDTSKSDVFINGGWSYNVLGLYQIAPDRPWGFNLAMNLTGREGYPQMFYQPFEGADGVTRIIQLFSTDAFRNDAIHTCDLRADKSFGFADYGLTLGVDVFNLLNTQDPLQHAGRVGASVPVGSVTEIAGGRTIRVGARIQFR